MIDVMSESFPAMVMPSPIFVLPWTGCSWPSLVHILFESQMYSGILCHPELSFQSCFNELKLS